MAFSRQLKRIFDVVCAATLLLVLSPLFAVIAVLVRVTSSGSVVFRQTRLGVGMKPFVIFKFRTMVDGSSATGAAVMTSANDPRLTRIGRTLRSTGLDELPQLWNVLNGTMSLVGPRPPVPHHPYPAEGYPEEYLSRFDVLPGLTGLAQVSGRNNLSWDQRLRLDAQYASTWSFVEDLRIITRTIRVLNQRLGLRHLPPDEQELGR